MIQGEEIRGQDGKGGHRVEKKFLAHHNRLPENRQSAA